jgi:hypothetical protein
VQGKNKNPSQKPKQTKADAGFIIAEAKIL